MTGTRRIAAAARTWIIISVMSLGCDGGRIYQHRVAVIDSGSRDDPETGLWGVRVTTPDTAAVGEEIPVRIRTYGDGCLVRDQPRAGGTSVDVDGLMARLQPWDVFDLGPRSLDGIWGCSDALLYWSRIVRVRFDEPGSATIIVRGISRATNPERITEVERTVLVR